MNLKKCPNLTKIKTIHLCEIVSQVQGKYPVKYNDVLIDHTNVKNYNIGGTYYDRLTCEDYGYETLTPKDCEDFEEMVNLNPYLHSDGSDICRTPSTVDVYYSGDDLSGLTFNNMEPEKLDSSDQLPDTKLFCKKNHNMIPLTSDHTGAMKFKYALEQIHNANMAVMTWAHVHCKSSLFGTSFSEDAPFPVYSGVNGIEMGRDDYDPSTTIRISSWMD